MKLYIITHHNDRHVVEASSIQEAVNTWIGVKEKEFEGGPGTFKLRKYTVEELIDVKSIIKASK